MRKQIVGVMGPGRTATSQEMDTAMKVGRKIAHAGYTLLTGGVAHGVMDAASEGAKQMGGLVIGVAPHAQPSKTHPVSKHVDILIETTFGEGRNVINARSSDLIVAIGMCPGTASEVCFAIKANKRVILMECDDTTALFFREVLHGNIQIADNIESFAEMLAKYYKG